VISTDLRAYPRQKMSSRRSTSERGTHSPSLANGDVHLDMGAGASGDGSDASSVEDEGVRHVRTIRSLQVSFAFRIA
jgi:hypothetical protein